MEQAGDAQPGANFVVGIAGGSASGKSTLAAALVQALAAGEPPLRAEVLGMDRYFYRSTEVGPTFVSPSTGRIQADCNHPDSADNTRLLADLETRCRAADAPDILIVEGLMALHVATIRERCDLRVFVELDDDERALRRLIRNLRGGRDEAERIATYYRECARVGHALYVEPSRVHADLILRGDGDFRRTAALVAAVVRDLRPPRT